MERSSDPAPAAITSLSYEAETNAARAAARKRYWRAIWIFAFAFSLVTVALAMTANVFYRLSVARTMYWPASLTLPAMNFKESDPILDAFASGDACERPADDEFEDDNTWAKSCAVLASLARGGATEAVKLIQSAEPSDDGELLPYVKAKLGDQLEDAANRRDWATCALMAWVALQMLDKQDSAPQHSRALDNRLLLLAGSCQFASLAFLAADDYAELTQRITTGTHLDPEYVVKAIKRPSSQVQAWGHYFDGIIKLRAREAELAATSFRTSLEAKPSGALREMALLGLARALFWRHTLAAPDPTPPPANANEVRAELKAIARAMARASFRSDVDHYVREVR